VPDATTIEANGFYSQLLIIGEHVGSHIDAPLHTVKGAKAIDAYPGDYFIAPYKKYAFDKYFDLQVGQMIGMEMVKTVEERLGIEPEEGDVILIQEGWARYYNPDARTRAERDWYATNCPGLKDEVMDYFASKKIRAIGFDNANGEGGLVDGVGQTFAGHTTYFHPKDIPIMENFADMSAAPPTGIFMAIPLPIGNGSGCPVRPLLFG
jgi:kynurenine formamidase